MSDESKKESKELKVVILLKENRAMVGVQSPECDPVYITLQGDLTAALEKVPELVEQANRQWEANPCYPKADLPAPPPSPAPAQRQPAQTTRTKPAPNVQPNFF